MVPPTKFQEALYRFNTKLMHIWFIISDYSPKRIIRRRKANKEFASIFIEPVVQLDEWDGKWYVDTGHSDVGPFADKKQAQIHADRIKEDYKVARNA